MSQKRLRDLSRWMQQFGESAPADLVAQKREELTQLEQERKDWKRSEKYKARYKAIKFVEKRKVIRRIQKVKKQLAMVHTDAFDANDDQADDARVGSTEAKLREELAKWESDLMYINHYPRNEKYVSLFPSNKSEEDPSAAVKREAMRKRILNEQRKERRQLDKEEQKRRQEQEKREERAVEKLNDLVARGSQRKHVILPSAAEPSLGGKRGREEPIVVPSGGGDAFLLPAADDSSSSSGSSSSGSSSSEEEEQEPQPKHSKKRQKR